MANPAPVFNCGLIAPPAERLTPKLAREWMKRRFPCYQALAAMSSPEDSHSRGFMAVSVEEMVRACMTAIESGKSVRLDSDFYSPLMSEERPHGWFSMEGPLEVLRAALRYDYDEDAPAIFAEVQPALIEMVGALLEVANRASDAESRRYREERKRWQQEEEENSPIKRLTRVDEKIRELMDTESRIVGELKEHAERSIGTLFEDQVDALMEEQKEIERELGLEPLDESPEAQA